MRMGAQIRARVAAASLAMAVLCATAAGSAAAANADEPRTPDGSTPLMAAAFAGDAVEAARLLKDGADVKAINSYGVNAMQLAADTANIELIRLLLKAGADPSPPMPMAKQHCTWSRAAATWTLRSCC